jgi:hypothetical protein
MGFSCLAKPAAAAAAIIMDLAIQIAGRGEKKKG